VTRSLLLALEASHYACSGWEWIDDTKYAYLFMEYKENKLDFVFKHFKTRAEISPHFLIDSNEKPTSFACECYRESYARSNTCTRWNR
jgi:hypothetical protein